MVPGREMLFSQLTQVKLWSNYTYTDWRLDSDIHLTERICHSLPDLAIKAH